jgi:putative ABC transport system permease protein
VLAIFGIFGLASFTAFRRQKEIAIRRVLGASPTSIVNLLSRQFLQLSMFSVPFAFAGTWWLVENWLNGFQQRIDQPLLMYLLSLGLVLLTVWITVASVALVTVTRRPAQALKHE